MSKLLILLFCAAAVLSCKETAITPVEEPYHPITPIFDTTTYTLGLGSTLFFNWYAVDSNNSPIDTSHHLETACLTYRNDIMNIEGSRTVFDVRRDSTMYDTLTYQTTDKGWLIYFRTQEKTSISLFGADPVQSPSYYTLPNGEAHAVTVQRAGEDTLTIAAKKFAANIIVIEDSITMNQEPGWLIQRDSFWYVPSLQIFAKETRTTDAYGKSKPNPSGFVRELTKYNLMPVR